MLSDVQAANEVGFDSELKFKPVDSKEETKRYVMDLMRELQMISSITGLQSLSQDIEVLLSRHVPTPIR